jgi:predicted glycosyltransferase
MTILFYAGHPAQYFFFRGIINLLRKKGHNIFLLIKTKDILEQLLLENKEEYFNILPEGRGHFKGSILWGLVRREIRLVKFIRNKKIDLFVGTDPSLAHVGWLKRIPVITVLEDDINVIPELARLTYPFTHYIVTPHNVKVGKFKRKQICYNGYMKLAYLHPDYFTAKVPDLPMPYSLIRLSGLTAYHDSGIKGIDENILDRLVLLLSAAGKVFISSEKDLPLKYTEYKLINYPGMMHDILSYAKILVSDSQSMSVEAAMLGTPSVRFSDFTGKISVLEELEHKYQLTFGISTKDPEKLMSTVSNLVAVPDLNLIFQERRQKMLKEKTDVTSFMLKLIDGFPESLIS